VQIDERAVIDFGQIYGVDPAGYTVLTYADTSTFTGPDPDPLLDHDDEIAFMATHAGTQQAVSTEPLYVVSGSGIKLTLTDPLDGGVAYVYLFESDGSLDPGMGHQPVTYDFYLLSGDYKDTYNTMSGPNPEDTNITTDSYGVRFADRWIRDETSVTEADASGVDILDRHKALFAPGTCIRSEDTFSAGEGAFIINREGPVRAIRGYVGANSGPTTYRIHKFYERHEEIFTALRVHPIPGILDFFDYSPSASGMLFHNDLNLDGVIIDGIDDLVASGEFSWEMVTGAQGTLVMVMQLNTDIPGFDYSSYYLDDTSPPDHQCTGDDFAYGSSGLWEVDEIPNTDPGVSEDYFIFEGLRTVVYAQPNQQVSFAQQRAAEILQPLSVSSEPYDPSTISIVEGAALRTPGSLCVRAEPLLGASALRIHLRSARAGHVDLRLHEPSGRLVSILFRGHLAAGAHSYMIELPPLPSGTYLVSAFGEDGETAGSKVVLVR
jgi:hypothetical protein